MEDVVLSPSQQAVVDAFPGFLLSDDKEMTISGPAGTGKTFLVQQLTVLAPAQNKIVKLLDPTIKERTFTYTATTNKAAEVLRGTLNKPTSTIHSTLGLRVRNDYKSGKAVLVPHRPPKPLSHTVIIVDEASMINDQLAKSIRDATRKWHDCKIVFIGDKYQLPPVMEDVCPIFRPGAPNVHHLTEIQRQAAGSPIIQLATQYRDLLDNPSETWPDLSGDGKSIIRYHDKTSWSNALRKAYSSSHAPDDYRVVAWSNNRVHKYNQFIREKVLNISELYRPGDKVVTNKPLFLHDTIAAPTDQVLTIKHVKTGSCMHTDVEMPGWYIMFEETGDAYAFQPSDWKRANGIKNAYAKDKNWGPVFYIRDNWADLRPIHASTVHKAQGSTYREVFVDVDDIGRNTHWRETVRLLYVAITRASHRVHLFGDISVAHQIRSAEDTLESFENVRSLLQY